jgi:hypothetical protein
MACRGTGSPPGSWSEPIESCTSASAVVTGLRPDRLLFGYRSPRLTGTPARGVMSIVRSSIVEKASMACDGLRPAGDGTLVPVASSPGTAPGHRLGCPKTATLCPSLPRRTGWLSVTTMCTKTPDATGQ